MAKKRKRSTNDDDSDGEEDDNYEDKDRDEDDDDENLDLLLEEPKRKPARRKPQPSARRKKAPPPPVVASAAGGSAAVVAVNKKPIDDVIVKRKAKRRQARKRQDIILSDDDEEEERDTSVRLTENGGYAHTLKSKLRISMANKGNTPWNKGGQRTAADRAKISEGVRARNRAILLEKLQKLGMTEDEWFAKKKEIKYLRERVRRAKRAQDAKVLAEQQEKLQSVLAETEIKTPSTSTAGENNNNDKAAIKTAKKENVAAKKKENVAAKKVMQAKVKQSKVPAAAETEAKDEPTATAKAPKETKARKKRNGDSDSNEAGMTAKAAVPVPGSKLPVVFARDINWQYHEFDSSEKDCPYEGACPNGGSGGLICCSFCAKCYSDFLTMTSKDIEEQKTRKVNKEVKELLGFLSGARSKLDAALRHAKQQSSSSGAGGLPLISRVGNNTDQRSLGLQKNQESENKQEQQQIPNSLNTAAVNLDLPTLTYDVGVSQLATFPNSEPISGGSDEDIETVAV